ncbi:unnamed protein product [Prorocentrum cordatum]|uniref:Uncharacterized protein n=1 Tax=Prorocentrum cordatum TaxID=2364126 RepID=A0ABN9YHJ7_9DINO|nr:unnamed protein product [Polarella glacialis]
MAKRGPAWAGDVAALSDVVARRIAKPNSVPTYPKQAPDESDPKKIMKAKPFMRDLSKLSPKLAFKLTDLTSAVGTAYNRNGSDWGLDDAQVKGGKGWINVNARRLRIMRRHASKAAGAAQPARWATQLFGGDAKGDGEMDLEGGAEAGEQKAAKKKKKTQRRKAKKANEKATALPTASAPSLVGPSAAGGTTWVFGWRSTLMKAWRRKSLGNCPCEYTDELIIGDVGTDFIKAKWGDDVFPITECTVDENWADHQKARAQKTKENKQLFDCEFEGYDLALTKKLCKGTTYGKKNTAVQSTKDLLQTFMDGKIKISDLKPAARKIKESLDSGSEAEATGAEASADLGEIECEGDEEEYEDEFDENSESGDDEDGEE